MNSFGLLSTRKEQALALNIPPPPLTGPFPWSLSPLPPCITGNRLLAFMQGTILFSQPGGRATARSGWLGWLGNKDPLGDPGGASP